MAILKTDVLQNHYQFCVEKAAELGYINLIIQGGLICEEGIETFDVDGNLQFRFSPPSIRVTTEHWEFSAEMHLLEKSIPAARGAFVWVEQVSDYLCLATAGAPIKMQPFRDMLTESNQLPINHPKEIWYDEVKVGRVMSRAMLNRANTFMHHAQHKIGRDKIKSYQRALWWFRHGANIEIESPLLAYTCFFNSLEILLQNEKSNSSRIKPKGNKKTKTQFTHIFGQDIGKVLFQVCYGELGGESLVAIRNDIDHGKIVELGEGMLRVLKNIATLKALIVDLALYLIDSHESMGGWLSIRVLEDGAEGLVILSLEEANQLGLKKSGSLPMQ
jgi:hypothetical protein